MMNSSSAALPARLNLLAVEPRMLFDGAGAVAAVNHDPVGAADCRVVAADSAICDGDAIAGNLAGDQHDSDPDGDTLRVAGIISGDWGGTPVGNVGTALDGVYGSILMQSDGSYTYTPYADLCLAPGQQVADTFTYTLCDDRGGKSSTTLTVHVSAAAGENSPAAGNLAPVGEIDHRNVLLGQTVSGQAVLGSAQGDVADTDGNGDSLCVLGVVSGYQDGTSHLNVGHQMDGAYGHLTMSADGSYVYTPYADLVLAPGQSVRDVFTYTIGDGRGGEDSTWLKFDITSPNHNPVANADQRVVNANRDPIAGNVLCGNQPGDATDTDVDGDYLLVTGVTAGNKPDVGRGNLGTPVQGQYGVLTLYADGSYRYEPNANLQLAPGGRVQDVFSYLICDHNGGEGRTTLSISLNGPARSNPVEPARPDNPGTPVVTPPPAPPAANQPVERETAVQTIKQGFPNNNSAIFVAPLAVPGLGQFSDIRPAALDVQRLEMPRDTFAPFAVERVLGEVQEMPAGPEKAAVAKPAVVAAQDDCAEADKPVAKLKPKVIKPTVLLKPELSGKRNFSEQVSVAKKGFVPPVKARAPQPARNC